MMTEASIRALEEAGLAAWPPASLRIDGAHRLGMTLGHPSKRLNCLTVLDPTDIAGGIGRLDREMRLYLRLGLTPTFRQSPLTPPLYAEEMDRRGWRAFDETDVMTRDLDAPLSTIEIGAGVEIGEISDARDFAETLARFRGHDAEAARQTITVLDRIGDGLRLWRLTREGAPEAVGMGVDGIDETGRRIIGLFSVTTEARARGRGHGRALTKAILADAARRRVALAWLQAEVDNQAARRLYGGLGFTPHHRYRYRVPLGF